MIARDTYTIFWREVKRYRKSPSSVLIRLVQPAIWIIVIGNTFAGTQPLIASVGFDGKYIEFMTPGVLILTAIFTSIFGGVNTLWDRRHGFMNRALASPISRSSIALGKMLSISLMATMQGMLIMAIALALGVRLPDYLMLAPIMGVVFLFSLGFSGISVTVAATAKSQETFWGFVTFLGMPLFMLSPALFPLELMPEWLGTLAGLNPVTYTILLVRELMTGMTSGIPTVLAVGIIACFVIAMILVASRMFRRDISKPF